MIPTTKTILGVAAVVAGIIISIVAFATPLCAICGPSDSFEALFYPETWALPFVWLPLTLILGTVLFWGGVALLISSEWNVRDRTPRRS